MADKLVQLTEDVKKQERQAMFGRVAAGLVHDLLHPIQNVGNNTRLLLRDDVDAETRQDCCRIIDRELTTIRRFLDDLRNIVKPKPVERFAMDINGAVAMPRPQRATAPEACSDASLKYTSKWVPKSRRLVLISSNIRPTPTRRNTSSRSAGASSSAPGSSASTARAMSAM